ncbi:hypothetical protein LX36DRAFT_590958, partial [Colletotrichum falcatum]
KTKKNTYNTGHSPVVTDPTTTPALTGLSMGERTGSRVFQWVWSYVLDRPVEDDYIASPVFAHGLPTIVYIDMPNEPYACLSQISIHTTSPHQSTQSGKFRG